jgi:thioredoxin reductase
VIGGSDETIAHAQLVRQWASDVIYFAHGSVVTAEHRERLEARDVSIIDEPVDRIVVENDRLAGVRLATGETVARSAVFVRPRLVPSSTLLQTLGCTADAAGWVAVDATGHTSRPGVWAAGNAVNPRAQVITAAGEGSSAAIAINNDLVEEDVAIAVRRRRSALR